MTQDIELALPQGSLKLQRLPLRRKQTLQAWDSADQLALTQLQDIKPDSRILLVNDHFGALGTGLSALHKQVQLTVWSDSFLAWQALQHNCQLNQLPEVKFVEAVATPQGPFDLVVMRVPKSHSLLQDQIKRLLPQLAADASLLLPIMVKHLDNSLYDLLTKLLGPLSASRAVKKARVLSAQPANASATSPAPVIKSWQYKDFTLSHYSGVYGRKRLDEGSQFLLENFPKGDFKRIIDLGCGNGILSLQAAKTWPHAQILGVDESYMAVASAKLNAEQNALAATCEFQVGNCLAGLATKSADLIMCNPPFHQQRVVGDQLAMAMFADASRVLDTQGELWVVGNRHLGYHVKLKRWFKHIEQQGKHPKFVVLRCRK
jgi:23S rRNA (guanine1835-N2)-methyltransferase